MLMLFGTQSKIHKKHFSGKNFKFVLE